MKTRPYQPSGELRRFTDRLLGGEALSKTESARLEELIEDDDALSYYVHSMQQDELMPAALAGQPAVGVVVRKWPVLKQVGQGLAWAAAACVVFALGHFYGHRPVAQMTTSGHVSHSPRITGLVGVEWVAGEVPDLLNGGDIGRKLAFRSGLAELTYGNGVRVTLQGPAELTITGPNAARLAHGRLVAAVPKGAEGFTVDYKGGTVVDLGTEFGLDVAATGKAELGVFDGEVELHRPNQTTLSLLANQALLLDSTGGKSAAVSIPLNREKFVRRIPTRDFRWEINTTDPVRMEFDVSHLVWKASSYLGIFKWMRGEDGVRIKDVELCLDGVPVSRNSSVGVTGGLERVHDNLFNLPLTEPQYRHGSWTLRAVLQVLPLAPDRDLKTLPISSVGTLLFEEGFVTEATTEDFIGSWAYNYDGKKFQRHFYADGTMNMTSGGVLLPKEGNPFNESRWWVDRGVLHLTIPGRRIEEEHVLRDHDTMIFVKNPYENAKRVGN